MKIKMISLILLLLFIILICIIFITNNKELLVIENYNEFVITTNSTNNTTYRFGVTICAAGTSQPIVSSTLTNTCPANFVNLDTAHTGITPSGVELVWFTNNTHSGTPLTSAQVSKAVTGIYYAYYYDYVKNCYSPASNAVTVNIITCCPVFTSWISLE